MVIQRVARVHGEKSKQARQALGVGYDAGAVTDAVGRAQHAWVRLDGEVDALIREAESTQRTPSRHRLVARGAEGLA